MARISASCMTFAIAADRLDAGIRVIFKEVRAVEEYDRAKAQQDEQGK